MLKQASLESTDRTGHYVAKDSNKIKAVISLATSAHHYNDQFSDEALMTAYSNGNVSAFEQLYLRHKDSLLRYFLRQVGSKASAEELFQDTWQSIIKASSGYKSSAKFSTYLYHVARNRLIDHYRKQGRADYLTIDDEASFELSAEQDTQPEQQLDQQQVQRQFQLALAQLVPAQREVLILKYENGMTVSEIAETIGDNHEAVKSRLRYAVNKLKQLMQQTNPLEVEL